ncbi:MAG TPA: PrgI family protein [Candidatus Caccenecus avistercoris]|nr:PrgI family protein [Candidatus Caccenecus avistercoris]
MEIKINKEIKNYSEKVYFGLTMRQFIFTIIACVMAIITYFVFNNILNKELISWLCIFSTLPFFFFGFFNYNGLNAEMFLLAFIKCKFLIPKKLKFKNFNLYYELLVMKNVK